MTLVRMTMGALLCGGLIGLSHCATSDWQGGVHAKFRFSQAYGLRAVDVPPDGPAAKAGLEQGDRILQVDGEEVQHLTLEQVVSRLRGPVGSYVELFIERNHKYFRLHIERAPYDEKRH